MNYKISILCCSLLCIACMGTEKTEQETFIITKRQKRESRNHINEDNGVLLLQASQKVAQCTTSCGLLQETLLNQGKELITQEKGFFTTAETKNLQNYRSTLEKNNKRLELINDSLLQIKKEIEEAKKATGSC